MAILSYSSMVYICETELQEQVAKEVRPQAWEQMKALLAQRNMPLLMPEYERETGQQ